MGNGSSLLFDKLLCDKCEWVWENPFQSVSDVFHSCNDLFEKMIDISRYVRMPNENARLHFNTGTHGLLFKANYFFYLNFTSYSQNDSNDRWELAIKFNLYKSIKLLRISDKLHYFNRLKLFD